jgi:hypothetical protein
MTPEILTCEGKSIHAAPSGAWDFFGLRFYKHVAPLELEDRAFPQLR